MRERGQGHLWLLSEDVSDERVEVGRAEHLGELDGLVEERGDFLQRKSIFESAFP